MTERIHLLLPAAEKERYRQLAAREGKSLSEWLRAAADDRAAAAQSGSQLDSVETLRAFFAEINRARGGREPDWDTQRRVIEESKAKGSASS